MATEAVYTPPALPRRGAGFGILLICEFLCRVRVCFSYTFSLKSLLHLQEKALQTAGLYPTPDLVVCVF